MDDDAPQSPRPTWPRARPPRRPSVRTSAAAPAALVKAGASLVKAGRAARGTKKYGAPAAGKWVD